MDEKYSPEEILDELESFQERIDAVARDLNSGENRFAPIRPWELGHLLGIDWEDLPAECSMTWRAVAEFDPDEFDQPYLENFTLLEGRVPPERYEELCARAQGIAADKPDEDLALTLEEVTLLKEAYREDVPSDWTIGQAIKVLKATDGTELYFEVLIGDAGDLENPKGPYQEKVGDVFDSTGWVGPEW